MFTHSAHNASALTPDALNTSTGEVSVQYMGKRNNSHYLFEKVTQIFCCKFKSNAILYSLFEKKSHYILLF